MRLRLYRYGQCAGLPGLSIGATRHVPRGVRREDYAVRGYFDVWLPVLAPSQPLMKAYLNGDLSFAVFARRYRTEMRAPEAGHVIQLVAATALRLQVNLGCFCEDENACHRSLLQELVLEAAEALPPAATPPAECASPPCWMPEVDD